MWGGLDLGGSRSIQVLLNKCARIVTGLPRRTRTRQLMTECNWLYFSEMVSYHSLLMLWKMIRWHSPFHLAKKFTLTDDNMVETEHGRILMTRRVFRCRSVNDWNALSQDLREMSSFPQFKRALRRDIIKKRPLPTPRARQIYWD